MPKKTLPARRDGAVWEKVTKGRGGIKWDSVVEKVWKDIGGNEEEMMSAEKFGRYKAEVEERTERREEIMSAEKFGRYKAEVEERTERRERLRSTSKYGEAEKHSMYGGLREQFFLFESFGGLVRVKLELTSLPSRSSFRVVCQFNP